MAKKIAVYDGNFLSFFWDGLTVALWARGQGDVQLDPCSRVVWHDGGISPVVVFIGDCIASRSCFPIINATALANWPVFVNRLRIAVVAIIVNAIADDCASDRTYRSGSDSAVATTDLATQQATGQTADDCAAGATLLFALWVALCGFIFGPALLAWYINLLDLRCHVDNAGEVIKICGLCDRPAGGQRQQCCRCNDACGVFCLYLHVESRFLM